MHLTNGGGFCGAPLMWQKQRRLFSLMFEISEHFGETFRAFRSLLSERSFHMTRSPKTVSIRHLHAAVKTALESAKKEHPGIKIDLLAAPGTAGTLPIYIRPPWICGFPIPWPEYELQEVAAFNKSFVANLAGNKQISALGVDGVFEPALYISGGNVTIGFAPADVSVTE
jgi:hypothetical protein